MLFISLSQFFLMYSKSGIFAFYGRGEPGRKGLLSQEGQRVQVRKKKWKSQASLVVQWLRVLLTRRGHRFNPCSKRISLDLGQLSPRTTTPEPWSCNSWSLSAQNLCHATREAARRTLQSPTREEPSLVTTRESLLAATKTQCSQR